MLISELIAELEKFKAEHGDLVVASAAPEEYWADPIWEVTVEKIDGKPWAGSARSEVVEWAVIK